MKTIRLFGIALFTALMSVSFSACGDSDDEEENNSGEQNTPTVAKRLVRVTEQSDRNIFTSEYTYDSQGRVVRKESKKNGNSDGYYTYAYTDNRIVKKHYYSTNYQAYITEYTLENGLIVTEREKDDYTDDTTNYTYENGYLSTKERSDRTYKYTWSNGNLKTIERHDNNSNEQHSIQSYDYSNYTAPQGFVAIDIEDELASYFGKTSKNLPSKYTKGTNTKQTFDWTLKDGMPVKMVMTEEKNGSLETIIYTYEWE